MEYYLSGCPIGAGTGHAAGRALLEALYREVTGEPLPPVLTAPRGKPYLEGSPWHFSITHTQKHVFCALSRTELGIDAEELDRNINLRLSERVLSPGEHAQYLAAPDKQRALLTFWVLKEAQAKCTGAGLTGFPNHTNFSLDDPRVSIRDGCLLAVIKEDDHAL